MDQGLTQEQVSVTLGVTECCVTNWELGHVEPEIRYYPKIIEFIGYYPYSPSGDLIDRLKAARNALGLTQRKLRKILGVDQKTISGWERHEHQPGKRLSEQIRAFLLDAGKSSNGNRSNR